MIKKEDNQFIANFNIKNFQSSKGQLSCFNASKTIYMHKVSGNSAAVDRSVVQAVWLYLMAELHPNVSTIFSLLLNNEVLECSRTLLPYDFIQIRDMHPS